MIVLIVFVLIVVVAGWVLYKLYNKIWWDSWWKDYNEWLESVKNNPEERNNTYFFRGVRIRSENWEQELEAEEQRNQSIYEATRK
jgi:hypothetical protein